MAFLKTGGILPSRASRMAHYLNINWFIVAHFLDNCHSLNCEKY